MQFPIILILVAALVAGYRRWESRRAVKMFQSALPESLAAAAADPQIVAHSIVSCNRAIISGIDCVLSSSAAVACRNSRMFGTLYAGYVGFRKNNNLSRSNECLNSLWETGLRITEIAHEIAVASESSLAAPEKRDMAKVREELSALSDSIRRSRGGSGAIKSALTGVRATISTHILRYSASMRHDDYNDGSVRYSYLRLLHNLYTYFLSMQKIV